LIRIYHLHWGIYDRRAGYAHRDGVSVNFTAAAVNPDVVSLIHDAVALIHDTVSLIHDVVAVNHSAVALIHAAVALIHDAVSLIHDVVSLIHDTVVNNHSSIDSYRNAGLYYNNKGDTIMPNEDWLPRKEQDLADLIDIWILTLSDSAKVAAFGWIQADVTDVLDKLNAFLTARAAYIAEDSSAHLHAKNAARDAAKSAMRDFANSSVRYNKRVDDETKERLLNGKKDDTRTDVPDPTGDCRLYAGERWLPANYGEASRPPAAVQRRGCPLQGWRKPSGKPQGTDGEPAAHPPARNHHF
jgi:hypothetical protein